MQTVAYLKAGWGVGSDAGSAAIDSAGPIDGGPVLREIGAELAGVDVAAGVETSASTEVAEPGAPVEPVLAVVCGSEESAARPGSTARIVPGVGEKFVARVVRFMGQSALVKLRKHVVALLPFEEYSWVDERVDLSAVLKRGAKIDVVVTKVVRKQDGRVYIRASHRQTKVNPWATIDAEHRPGEKVWAQVQTFGLVGAWVVLETGYRARVPLCEIARTEEQQRAEDVLQIGQWIEVQLRTIDKDYRHITASVRGALETSSENNHRAAA